MLRKNVLATMNLSDLFSSEIIRTSKTQKSREVPDRARMPRRGMRRDPYVSGIQHFEKKKTYGRFGIVIFNAKDELRRIKRRS